MIGLLEDTSTEFGVRVSSGVFAFVDEAIAAVIQDQSVQITVDTCDSALTVR